MYYRIINPRNFIIGSCIVLIVWVNLYQDGWNSTKTNSAKTYFKSINQNEIGTTKQNQTKKEVLNVDTSGTDYSDSLVINELIKSLKESNNGVFFPANYWEMSFSDLTTMFGRYIRQQGRFLKAFENVTETWPAWYQFLSHIRQHALYRPEDPVVEQLLRDEASLPIVKAMQGFLSGTQYKTKLKLSNGAYVIFKPMRYAREVETNPNHYLMDETERHFAEIAAFHLDRILGFYRVPPTVGRMLNLTELKPLLPLAVQNTFFTSAAGNTCFYGLCHFLCDYTHAYCGQGEMIEASFMTGLAFEKANLTFRNNPFRPSYSREYPPNVKWMNDETLCDDVLNKHHGGHGKHMLDTVDIHTFDYLTGNRDRRTFPTFEEFEPSTFPILYDNGRGFGRIDFDYEQILFPLKKCCVIRKSTVLKYIKLYEGPSHLGDLMRASLESDPLRPILLEGHLTSLDRRVRKILVHIDECLKHKSIDSVILSDDF